MLTASTGLDVVGLDVVGLDVVGLDVVGLDVADLVVVLISPSDPGHGTRECNGSFVTHQIRRRRSHNDHA